MSLDGRIRVIGLQGQQCCNYQKTTEIALSLIENGADCDYEDIAGNNLLHYAVFKSRFAHGFSETRLIAALLKKGVPVNKANRDGKTPLYYAIRKDIIDYLVSQGGQK